MKLIKSILLLAVLFCLGCVASKEQKQLESDLKVMVAKQDSIMGILKKMENQTNFIANKVGWRPPEDTLPKEIPLANSFTIGADKPVLTLVEFSDFQCPYCAQLSPVLDSIVKVYPDKVKLVFKHFPLSFHKQAVAAHTAALAAGQQGRFFDYRAKLAPKFRKLNDSTYLALAASIGLDMDAFKSEYKKEKEAKKIIDRDIALGRKVGVTGTPTLFGNGKKVRDRSFSGLEKLIKQYGG